MKTRILKIQHPDSLGSFHKHPDGTSDLTHWTVFTTPSPDLSNLREAAHLLRTTDTPVGFPTETVYGLGADATRPAAVKGIYAAKGRPADNPLIVHISDLAMLRRLLLTPQANGEASIPSVYAPLVARFWPGPLTILLPVPSPSPLAPEVTAGLATFGARMPASPLARALIALVGEPLAAPSANASTRPSPTTAAHVADDLEGRIELILDGGACGVGVESTVVDGLGGRPTILRPGGVSLEELRGCEGWEGVEIGYRDGQSEEVPRAPGMKYKHYSPRARVVLYEAGGGGGEKGGLVEDVREVVRRGERSGSTGVRTVGVIRTGAWPVLAGLKGSRLNGKQVIPNGEAHDQRKPLTNGHDTIVYELQEGELEKDGSDGQATRILDINLGSSIRSIAQGLFSALRELDQRGADVIFVEGIADREDIAAAVMNRLRKAASEIRT